MTTGELAYGAKYEIDGNFNTSEFGSSNTKITNINEVYNF